MNKPLDLSGVKIFSNTKDDIIDAMDLIGQEFYMSDDKNFKNYVTGRLTGVQYSEDDDFSFLGKDEDSIFSYIYCILAKDAKFKEEKKLLYANYPFDMKE